MARYAFVLFDADNTLFDFDAAERGAMQATFARLGYPYNDETVAIYQGINRPLWAAYARGELTQEQVMIERFRRLYDRLGGWADPVEMNAFFLGKLAEGAELLPGALALIRALAGRCTLAIVTNGATEVQHPRFAASPITPYFDHIFISQEMGCQKPEPRFFDLVCQHMGIAERARAVIVGDALDTDILGGQNAGIDTIWYNPHRRKAELTPTWEVADLEEIIEIVL